MTNVQGPFLEDMFPESLSEIYTLENINSMVSEFEELFNINFSNEIFDSLEGNTERYIRTALEIKEAINIYEKHSGKKFNYNDKPMNNIVDMTEMRELNTQMENFKNNGPIDANINPITQQNRKGFKDRISGLLDIFKK